MPLCQVSQFLAQPDPAKLNKLLPCELEDSGDLLLAIQVNKFDCGGIGIGVCFSHIIMDAISIVTFMNSWAAVGRGDRCNAVLPSFNLASLFPPKDILSNFNRKVGIAKEKIVTKRFVFTDSAISALTAKYAAKPTRVEALAFDFHMEQICCCYQRIGVANTPRVYSVVQAVNLRPRMNPPLPDSYFGNLSRFAVAFPSLDTNEEGFDLVTQMREAVRKIDDNYVKKLQEGDEHLNFIKGRAENLTKGEVDSFRFTSLCHFPLYGADFGWGKPVWVTMATLPYKNLTLFMPTRYGQGVEAWINMEKNDIVKLEADKEFVTLDHFI
ncbi:hypothetical protein RHGRI_034223 [Rhododendron griersonianum]|uniref:Uncharacterized protein n=1 Tax=Rhododendron griersonianum TaxID=479676 RepID=A0AAV6I2M8_9ERIC|nr:hypothetical protein RHGRI_034223 [Rhododendron griersonianum]